MIQPPENHPPLNYDAVRQRLAQLAQTSFPDWTDHGTANFGNLLLDLFAYVADVLGFYIDRQAAEGRLATVSQRENAVALARMLGYTPTGVTAARAQIEAKLDAPHDVEVVWPAGFVVRTSDVTPAVEFRLIEPIRLVAGEVTAFGVAENSLTQNQVADATGTADQRIALRHARYLDRSLRVRAADGRQFFEVSSFLDSGPNDLHFVVLTEGDDRATVCFGNGIMGAAPRGRLDLSYKTGGGAAGNVNAGSISVLSAPVLDVRGSPVRANARNPAAANGGADRESIESIRQRAPASLRKAQRTITREDFETNACRVPGVARALMTTHSDDPQLEVNTGRLYIVPDGLGTPTAELSAAVLREVTYTYPCTLTFQVEMGTPSYLPINVEVETEPLLPTGHFLPGESEPRQLQPDEGLSERVRGSLRDLFALNQADGAANPRANFGYYLGAQPGSQGDVAWSEVVTAVCQTAGVRKVRELKLNGAQQDITVQPFEFPVLGEVKVSIAQGPGR